MNNTKTISQLVVKNISLVWLFGVLGAPLGYLIRVILARNLDIASFGMIYSVMGLLTILGIFNDLGLTETLKYYGVRFYEKKQYTQLKSSIVYAFVIQFISSLVLASLLYFYADAITINYFHAPGMEEILKIFALYFIGANLLQVITALFNITQQVYYSYALDLVRLFGVTGAVVLFSISDITGVSGALSWLIGLILSILVGAIIARKKFNFLRKAKVLYDKKLFKKLVTYAKFVVVGSAAMLLLAIVDMQVVTFFLGIESAAFFSNGMAIAKSLTVFISPFGAIFFPLGSKLHVNNDRNILQGLLNKIYTIGMFASVPILILLVGFSSEVNMFLFGVGYEASNQVIVILSFATFFLIFTLFHFSFYGAFGIVKDRAILVSCAVAANMIIDIIMVKLFGMQGVAWTTLLVSLGLFIISFVRIRNEIGFTLDWTYFFKTLVLGVILYIMVYVFKIFLNLHYVLEGIVIGAIGLIMYIALGWLLKLIDKETLNMVNFRTRQK